MDTERERTVHARSPERSRRGPRRAGRALGIAAPPPPPAAGPVLLRTKLTPPPARAGLVARPRLDALLDVGARSRLCLVEAPAGSGKTTLLAAWCRQQPADRSVAWLSLDEDDDEPGRFWAYVIEALRTVRPTLGEAALSSLPGAGSLDLLKRVVLPQLLNDLADLPEEVLLVLDDLHVVTDPTCGRSLAFALDHLPANVHVVAASRVDPLLPLARLRGNGDLAELRITDLEFSDGEADALLNDAMGLGLSSPDVQRLVERTEGWAAGLHLAGLSLRGRERATALVDDVEYGHRHVLDYVAGEVLGREPEPLRAFLLRTSILQRFSAPLCDNVLETHDAAAVLGELERGNQFLVPLDDQRRWYRYHHVFGDLLRFELEQQEPGLVPVLHARAAAWFRAAGDVELALHHALAADQVGDASELVAQHWLPFVRSGRVATVERWLGQLGEDVVLGDPALSLVAAWVGGQRNAPREALERWLQAVDGVAEPHPLPVGVTSAPFATDLIRALYAFDDVGGSVLAARRALETADRAGSAESGRMGAAVLASNLYLAGEREEARSILGRLAATAPQLEAQPYVAVALPALRSLLDAMDGRRAGARRLARRAVAMADRAGVRYEPLCWPASVAHARTLADAGALDEAEQVLEAELPLLSGPGLALAHAHALLELALVRHGGGRTEAAQEALEDARATIHAASDPGMLPTLLRTAERTLRRQGRPPALGRRLDDGAPLTERETVVLRLLASALTQREIARELSVSVNTVRTHVQGIYRKIGTSSRREAVERGRRLGLIGSRARRTGD